MVAEIMETSRLYARTCAKLDPSWAVSLGTHILKVAHSEQFWDAEKGRVMVKRRSRLYGLELESRAVGYGKVNPRDATEIFIREGLVNDTITWPFDFTARNREVKQKVESVLTRTRDSGYLNLDEAVYRFYAARLENVSAVAELVDLVRERNGAEPEFLEMKPEDLRDPETLEQDTTAYPGELPLENRALPLNYAYRPGQADDGVTLEVTLKEASGLTSSSLDWAVPGHLVAKIEHYLRALPKEWRRALVPMAETAKTTAAELSAPVNSAQTLPEALANHLNTKFGIRVTPTMWDAKPLLDHLRVRVRVCDGRGKELVASRELEEVQALLDERRQKASARIDNEAPRAWKKARERWEKQDQTSWSFGDIPAQVQVAEKAGVPLLAYPGIKTGVAGVALRLFKTEGDAQQTTRLGLAALLDLQLRHDLGWLQRDLKSLRSLGTLTATLVPMPELQKQANAMLHRWVCDP